MLVVSEKWSQMVLKVWLSSRSTGCARVDAAAMRQHMRHDAQCISFLLSIL